MLHLVKEMLGLEPTTGPWGLLAEFETPSALYHGCEKVRDAGFRRWDAHSPFPVHGLEKAMGVKPSLVPWIVLVAGVSGALIAFTGQWWVHSVAYPLVISGKPYFAWPAYVPITFELGVLLGAFGAFFGMLGLNELPRWHHALFSSKRFERVTDDRFFISIESADAQYDEEKTRRLLEEAGAVHVEAIER